MKAYPDVKYAILASFYNRLIIRTIVICNVRRGYVLDVGGIQNTQQISANHIVIRCCSRCNQCLITVLIHLFCVKKPYKLPFGAILMAW